MGVVSSVRLGRRRLEGRGNGRMVVVGGVLWCVNHELMR